MADCNIDDALSRHMAKDIFKYWTSYRKGGIRFLVGQTLIPAAVSWVLEQTKATNFPTGSQDLAEKLWVGRNVTEWERVLW